MNNKVNILWTSGWDSTFRLLQLVQKNVTIQPYYVIDIGRPSTLTEIQRMTEIKDMIYRKWPEYKGKIEPTIYIEINDIEKNDIVTSSYKTLRENAFMGSQYEWLGWLSKNISPLELCIHEDDKAHHFIKNYTKLVKNKEKGEYYEVNTEDRNIMHVFGSYHFPILNYTKVDMMNEAKENGFYDIMKHTWFCFTPINNEPCGLCNPCKYAIEEGMSFRLSNKALMRNKFRPLSLIHRRIVNKLIR